MNNDSVSIEVPRATAFDLIDILQEHAAEADMVGCREYGDKLRGVAAQVERQIVKSR
jgi:hypothetical protein